MSYSAERCRKIQPVLPPRRCPRVPKDLDAGPLEAEVQSFVLHMAAEGKAPRRIRIYSEAVRWFAAAYLLRETGKRRWEEVDKADLRRWTVRLLGEYITAYVGNQFRACAGSCAGSLSRMTARTRSKGCTPWR
jgi:hypothetical protein